MRQTSIILLFTFMLAGPTSALAQRRVPDTGMVAVGASIGAALPEERALENGLELVGNVEGYLTPRLSIRGTPETTKGTKDTKEDMYTALCGVLSVLCGA
jgi:hypothetical protein